MKLWRTECRALARSHALLEKMAADQDPDDPQGEPLLSLRQQATLLEWCDTFLNNLTLDTTYRMNREICIFPARSWYQKALTPPMMSPG